MLLYICVSILLIAFFPLLNFTVLTLFFSGKKKLDFGNIKILPKVSIFKPIKDSDDALGDNLETFFKLDYPDFELIFGIDSTEEEPEQVIEKLMKKYPDVTVKIVPVGMEKILNPKVETLIAMEKESLGTLYWISDSNTRVERETLKSLVHEYLAKGSKIVFSLIRGMGSKTFASVIENCYLSYYVSGSIISAWTYIKKPAIVGKSMLVEKEALNSLGGFEYFKQFLAEDQIMGETFRRNNIYVSTNATWITNFNSHSTIRSFCSRISRWAKMRFHGVNLYYLLEIFTYPIGLSLIFCIFLGKKGLYLVLGSVVLRVILEYVNFIFINTDDRKKLWAHLVFPLCVLVKEFLTMVIYFVPFFDSKVVWRGKHIKIGNETKIFVEQE